jgi:hypothetical protein
VVQLVPQLTLQSFFDSQLNVAPLGAAPPSPADPSVHVPPDAQEHVEPLHEQGPLQSGELLLEAPEQATTMPATVAANASLSSTVAYMPRERTTRMPRWSGAYLPLAAEGP